MSYILGISAFYHDSAAALIEDGDIKIAIQEERLSRKKHDNSFPILSIKYILNEFNLKLSELSAIVFYEKPFLKFERLVETHIAFSPRGFASFSASMPIWLREKLFQKNLIKENLKKIDNTFKNDKNIKFSEHHLSHAASAFYPSPFEESLILTLDGVGEWATTSINIGRGNKIERIKEINFPHSLGLLYSTFTSYLGFKVNSGEYKLMGLAPYGRPIFKSKIYDYLIKVFDDGSFQLNMEYFNFATGLTMFNKKFEKLFGQNRREPEKEKFSQFHMDIASSIQEVTEEIIIKICKYLKKNYKFNNLCLAGGVALNCVANGKILEKELFENVYIQPAAGDAGGALGAALTFWYQEMNNKRAINFDQMRGSYLGPNYNQDEIKLELDNFKLEYEVLDELSLYNITAKKISEGNVVGWFQDSMEFGPRALGNRSILADPRNKNMQKKLNLKIKFRESFRPFAPSILKEKAKIFFNINHESPYMLFVASINDTKLNKLSENDKNLKGFDKLKVIRSEIPAVTHVDNSSRVQTVDNSINKKFYRLIDAFYKKTNIPILINTSFNIRGEPIVCSPKDAINCFLGTEMDILVIGNFMVIKNDKQKIINNNYKNQYELD